VRYLETILDFETFIVIFRPILVIICSNEQNRQKNTGKIRVSDQGLEPTLVATRQLDYPPGITRIFSLFHGTSSTSSSSIGLDGLDDDEPACEEAGPRGQEEGETGAQDQGDVAREAIF
jgi:hypothetical protein